MKNNKTFLKEQGKSNVVYISSYKKRNKVKPYAKFDLDWQEILRANNQDKRLADATVILSARLAYELHKNNERPVFLSSHWFEKATKKKRHQNLRLRKQLAHIFHFKLHKVIMVDGELLFNVFEVWYTLESKKIMNLEDVIIDKIIPLNPEENRHQGCSKNAPRLEHKCSLYIDNKALVEEEALAYSSSTNANNEKLKIKSSESESLEKSSLGDDFLTLPNPPEPILDEDNEMKAQIIPLKPERNTQFELNQAIFKTFGTGIAEELIQRCQFILEPNRIGIKVGQGLTLSDTDKKKLRSCIHDTYGENIKIVSLNQSANELNKEVDLQPKVEEPTLSETPKNESCLLWQKFQRSLHEYFPPEITKHAMTAWFSKLKATQILSANKLILTGSDFYIDYIFRQFEAAIEHIAKTNKITVELHFESKSSKPIIFTPKGRI